MSWVSLGERLIRMGELDPKRLEEALTIQRRTRRPLGEILRAHHLAPSPRIAEALAEQARSRFLPPALMAAAEPWEEPVRELGPQWCRTRLVAPCRLDGESVFALTDPFDVKTGDLLRGRWIGSSLAVAAPEDVARVLALAEDGRGGTIDQQISEVEDVGIESGQLPVLLRQLIDRAVDLRATDLHIEPLPDTVLVRARIDGLMRTLYALPGQYHPNLLNVLSEWAALPHGESRRLLSGHFPHAHPSGPVDIRLAAVPAMDGPTIVLRLLDQGRSHVRLAELGYSSHSAHQISELLRIPYGLLLVTGPTGSGKTTTLYAIVNQLNGPHIKVVTVEDPVEVRLARVQQVSIHEALGITFALVARAFLRQDPDVVLIGEVRDADTAREAIRAALTGRRVLSTLHTHDSAGAIPRLLELGVEPGLLAQTLIGVIAQRLVRRRCPVCQSAPAIPGRPVEGDPNCRACAGAGETGRVVLSEVLTVSPRVREAIERRASYRSLRALVAREEFHSLVDDARTLMAEGRISLAEAERILGPLEAFDRSADPAATDEAAPGPLPTHLSPEGS